MTLVYDISDTEPSLLRLRLAERLMASGCMRAKASSSRGRVHHHRHMIAVQNERAAFLRFNLVDQVVDLRHSIDKYLPISNVPAHRTRPLIFTSLLQHRAQHYLYYRSALHHH